jgi:hypothetical protein
VTNYKEMVIRASLGMLFLMPENLYLPRLNIITATNAAYATNAGNSDTLDGHHWSEVQTAIATSSDAGHSFSTNGYQKLGSGLIIQWCTRDGDGYYYLPIAFPHGTLSTIGTLGAYQDVVVIGY